MGKPADGSGNEGPAAEHQPRVIHTPGHQHRNPESGRFMPCPPVCATPTAPGQLVGAPYTCNSEHDRWITTAIDAPGRLRLMRHIQSHYNCELAPKYMVKPGTAAVAFAAMLADTFCVTGLFRTHSRSGNPIDRFAYFKSPLNDYRWAIEQGNQADIQFVTSLLLSGEWKSADIEGFLPIAGSPQNLIDFDPTRRGGPAA